MKRYLYAVALAAFVSLSSTAARADANDVAAIRDVPSIDAEITRAQARLAALMVRRGQVASNDTVRAATPAQVLAVIRAEQTALQAKLKAHEAVLDAAEMRYQYTQERGGYSDKQTTRQAYSEIVQGPKLVVMGIKRRLADLEMQELNLKSYLKLSPAPAQAKPAK